jgi:hypothetical protein
LQVEQAKLQAADFMAAGGGGFSSFGFRNKIETVTSSQPGLQQTDGKEVNAMHPDAKSERKAYSPPHAKQVTENQARQLLKGYADRRNQATVSLFEVLDRKRRRDKSSAKRGSAAKKLLEK